LLRLARPCCGCLVVGSLVTWPWGRGRFSAPKIETTTRPFRSIFEAYPGPLSTSQDAQMEPNFFSRPRQDGTAQGARIYGARGCACGWPAGACGRVGSLNGTLARAAIQTVTQASEASAKSFIVRSQRSEALLATVDDQRARSEAVAQPSGHQFIMRTRRLAAPWSGEGLLRPLPLTTASVKMRASLTPPCATQRSP
jgi:hypothetical protein